MVCLINLISPIEIHPNVIIRIFLDLRHPCDVKKEEEKFVQNSDSTGDDNVKTIHSQENEGQQME